MKKRILSFILCITTVFTGFFGVPVTKAAGVDETNYCVDISEYRTGEKEAWTYPSKEGYVFAGWYSDASLEQKYAITDSTVTGGAYAKFVDEDVLSVKCQMNALANISDDTMSLRMLTSVDDLAYQSVGFRFQTGATSVNFMNDTVYTSILVNGKVVEPKVAFTESSNYIIGHSLNNIPKRHYGSEFTITPVWVTLDGTTVEGVERSLTIREDYKVAEDKTVTYQGGAKDFWFYNIKINANQWITFDLEGIPAGGAGSVYFYVNEGKTTLESWNNGHLGSKYYYKAKGDKIRFYGQVYGTYENHTVGIRLFDGHGAESGTNITISNLRITDEPENALYYNIDCSGGGYFEPSEFLTVTATTGQILSYKVQLQDGTLKEQVGIGDPGAWIRVNDDTDKSAVRNVYRTKRNADGSYTLEVKVVEDLMSFRPTFSIKDLPEGITETKMEISDIQVNDALNNTTTGKNINFNYTMDVVKGATLSFDLTSESPLTVYMQYEGKASGDIILSHRECMRGTVTLSYQFPMDTTNFSIVTRNWDDTSTAYTATISNLKVTQAKPLAVDATSGFPYEVTTSGWPTSHVQNIAMDPDGYMYYSFKSILVKVNMTNGIVEGSVKMPSELLLGDMDFYNGKLYGAISGSIPNPSLEYLAIFDPDAITEVNMDCSEVMQVVYLSDLAYDVVADKYGLKGMEGFTFGEMPGDTSGKQYIFFAGTTGSIEEDRTDKNYQVLFAYDSENIEKYAFTYDAENPYADGPKLYRKLFMYTGQHFSGPQSLTYDYDSGDIWAGLYAEVVDGFPPYRLFVIDHSVAPIYQALDLGDNPGVGYDESETYGYVLTLKAGAGIKDEATGIWGYTAIPQDVACGFVSLGDNYFYAALPGSINDLQYAKARLYYLDRSTYTFSQITP